jgi:predicted DNA-binding transcriptional regulator YafY
MRRTDRLYSLVEELRARAPRALSRTELAEFLEVTPRTIERDIMALQEAGVPIWSQRGRGGGYAIDPKWTLPPLNFDATEALAVIAALATARALPFAEAGRRAERKLLAAMNAGEATRAKELAGRLRLGQFGEPATQRVISVVEQAVVDRRVVELGYRDRTGEVTTRLVEAHGLQMSPAGSYLVGWCRLRDAGRSFRLDRIVSARPTEEIAPQRALDELVDWIGDAVPPTVATEGGLMPQRTRRTAWGPPRNADNTTGSSAEFARAIATGLPGVQAKVGRQRTSFQGP